MRFCAVRSFVQLKSRLVHPSADWRSSSAAQAQLKRSSSAAQYSSSAVQRSSDRCGLARISAALSALRSSVQVSATLRSFCSSSAAQGSFTQGDAAQAQLKRSSSAAQAQLKRSSSAAQAQLNVAQRGQYSSSAVQRSSVQLSIVQAQFSAAQIGAALRSFMQLNTACAAQCNFV